MKHLILLLAILLMDSAKGLTLTISEVHAKVETTLLAPGSDESDISWITDGNRELVFDDLLRRKREQNSSDKIIAALARVGHEKTLKMLADDLKTPKGYDRGLLAAPENAIPHIMFLVYDGTTDDPNITSPGDVVLEPVRKTAISRMLGRVTKSKKFPSNTRSWAKKMSELLWVDMIGAQTYKNEKYVGLITGWWEHNQTAILEKRYADATWLPLYKGRLAVMDEAEIAERKMDRQRGKFPWFATGATFAETARANPWHWLGLGALVGLALWRILRWKSARKQSLKIKSPAMAENQRGR
jgi:hypothetical protein